MARTVGLMLTVGVALLSAACDASGTPATNGSAEAKDSSTSAPSAAHAASGASENTPGSTTGAVPRVVILGTSLTAGLGLDPDKAYPAQLQRTIDSVGLKAQVVNAGLSGETSAGALRRASWVLDQPAQLVVLEVGANDGLRGVDPDSTYANIVKLIGVVKQQRPDAAIALIQMEAPTNLGGGYTTRFRAAYSRAAKETGVPLWPFLLDGVAGVPRLNQGDGIHPNEEGAKRVAATVWTHLEPALRTLAR